jgi:hypothetical protein
MIRDRVVELVASSHGQLLTHRGLFTMLSIPAVGESDGEIEGAVLTCDVTPDSANVAPASSAPV